jgi:Pyruvate/2-oxoacid:ferredoxin oxidoreductase delta subunit
MQPKVKRICETCGKEFLIMQCRLRNGNGKHCSNACRLASITSNGKSIHEFGYVLLKKPEHPSSNKWGFVYEHILVAEKKLGRNLLPKEVIHHIDGNVENNDPANIEILPNHSAHKRLHDQIRLLKSGIDRNKEKQCAKCKQIKPLDNFSPTTNRGNATLSSYCKPCRVIIQTDFIHQRREKYGTSSHQP